ncbi:MAG: methyltransferase domain-containing protein [Terriglobales bacterium]
MKIRISSELEGLSGFLYRFAVRRLAKSYSPYHPIFLGGERIGEGERACVDRWATIAAQLRLTGAQTLLDLGCAEGYFVQQAARYGCLAVGIDADVLRLSLAQASATLNRVQGAGFIYAELTPEFINTLPSYDAVLFLSVLHHIMYEQGVDYARDYMRRLRGKVRQFMIFDMAQSNETRHAWASLLPDMGADPHAWIAEFLRSAGFRSVEKVGDTDAYQGPVRRALFRIAP